MLWDLCLGCLSLLSYIVTEVIGVDLLPRALLMNLGISNCGYLLNILIFHFFVLCEALLLSKLFRSLKFVNFHLLL